MAKDDYYVVVYKILLYLYACLKRTILFDQDTYDTAIGKESINPEYLSDIYVMMQNEGLIEGVKYKTAWGGNKIFLSSERDISITPSGIEYLSENSTMAKVKDFLLKKVGIIADLITIMHL